MLFRTSFEPRILTVRGFAALLSSPSKIKSCSKGRSVTCYNGDDKNQIRTRITKVPALRLYHVSNIHGFIVGIEPDWNLVRPPIKQKREPYKIRPIHLPFCTVSVFISQTCFCDKCPVIFQIAYLFRGSIEPLVFICTFNKINLLTIFT